VLTKACHWSLSWGRCIHSTPSHPISLRSILILSSYLCPDLSSGHFPLGFLIKILYEFFIFPMCTTCPAHLILLDLITQYFGRVQVMKLHCAVFLSLLLLFPSWVQIFSSPFSQTPSIYAPSLVWEMEFHTHTKQQVKL